MISFRDESLHLFCTFGMKNWRILFLLFLHCRQLGLGSPLPFACGSNSQPHSKCESHFLFSDRQVVRELELRLNRQYGAPEVSAFRKMLREFETAPADLSADEEAAIKETLTKHFGADFYARYQNLEKERPTDATNQLVRNSVKLMKQQFHKLAEVQNHHVKPMWQHFLAVAAMEKATKSGGDVPCRDAATCKKLEHLVNRCNYARQGAMFASNLFNTVTHVLNGLISVMCGCLFVGPVHLCVLKNFPYTCMLPYPVYASLYMGTSQVWEVVKATSNLCRLYGDPGLGSTVQ